MSTTPDSRPPGAEDTVTPVAVGTAKPAFPSHCSNCGVALHGPHCHDCGQPTKGLVRHFSSIIGDFVDSVFDLDSRLLRTLWPLFGRPGFLSREYFEGHRVRFVSPVRLFVFLIILAFFLAQISFDWSGAQVMSGGGMYARATSVEEVERLRDEALQGIEQAREANKDVPGVSGGLAGAEAGIRAGATQRIRELTADQPGADGSDSEPKKGPQISFGKSPWDKESNPIAIGWLPDSTNAFLNDRVERMQQNVGRIQDDPNLLKDGIFGLLPQVLFVMLPLFAVLLKIAYVFKRRLYMEHLIVALHSHAFLALSIILLLLLSWLRARIDPDGFPDSMLGWTELLLWLWMPLYLLLTQKRVYRQGWIMTLLKYAVLGVVYLILLSFALMLASLLSLATI
ncbi:MAG: DUF3667 domain-containing protein [Xanthomonadales bacterium]|nr:DUF3667 domain-containing protein [Xanthomonadales bacterium]